MHTHRSRASRTWRGAAVLAIGASIAAVAVGTTTSAGPWHGDDSNGLRILLTNDDGWAAPGITAVYDALVAEGHEVTMVAPLGNQSGVGARITFGGALTVTQPEAGKYAVAGSPADSTEFGLSTVLAENPPDIVISGTNEGQNIAGASIHSGTVGAAVTALNDRVPAIAISTEVSFTGQPEPPYEETADFLVELLDELQSQRRGSRPLLPAGVGLNVNYPIVDDGGEPSGVRLTRTGIGFIDPTYNGPALPPVGGSADFSIGFSFPTETVRNADSTALAADEIAISVITGNYDVGVPGQIDKLVRSLD